MACKLQHQFLHRYMKTSSSESWLRLLQQRQIFPRELRVQPLSPWPAEVSADKLRLLQLCLVPARIFPSKLLRPPWFRQAGLKLTRQSHESHTSSATSFSLIDFQQRITASTAQIAPNSPVRALVSSTVSAAGQSFHVRAPAFTAVPGASRNFFPLSSTATAVSTGRFEFGLLNPTSETGLRRSSSSSQLPHAIGRMASTAVTATNVPAHTLVSGSVSVAGQCSRAQASAFTVGPAASTNSVPHAPTVTVCSTGRVNIGSQDPTLKSGPKKSLDFCQLHNFKARALAQTATATEILHAQAPGTATVWTVSKSFCAQASALTTESAASTEFFPLAPMTPVATTDRIECGLQNPTLETFLKKSLNFSQLPRSIDVSEIASQFQSWSMSLFSARKSRHVISI
ncbi:hypothetical protein QAD02_013136 [Eretmocerus hayati]|uniref:Uncharacterized protein n=1 Tax=Eretmocerus hayati TaxID=131215 RepID=A0ACC2P1B3_9HYME|nr:hypothetical protein QAD02_013136 [Eretmocerus hayati]